MQVKSKGTGFQGQYIKGTEPRQVAEASHHQLLFIGHTGKNDSGNRYFCKEMNIAWLTYRKEQLFKFLLSTVLVFTLSGISTAASQSSFQPQKPTTECFWHTEQQEVSNSTRFYATNSLTATTEIHYIPGTHNYLGLLAYNRLIVLKFRHQVSQFTRLKPTVMRKYRFDGFLSPLYEPAIA